MQQDSDNVLSCKHLEYDADSDAMSDDQPKKSRKLETKMLPEKKTPMEKRHAKPTEKKPTKPSDKRCQDLLDRKRKDTEDAARLHAQWRR